MYEMKNLNQKTGLVLLILAILIYIGMALWFDFTQDDAYITFRYAANFVDGHGLVFNIGERVEGYTNFLWTIFMILGLKAGFNLILFSKILGVICGAAAICMLYLLAGLIPALRSIWRGAACLIAGTAYSFAYWSVAGLETAAFALAVIASIYFYCRGNYLAAPILVLATLLRPEGGLVFAFIIVFDLISARRITDFVITTAGIYILSLIPFLAFKYFYFGGILPNPFYAKTDFTFYKYYDGLKYAGRFFWHYLGAGLFILPAVYMLRKGDRVFRIIILFLFIYTIYIILVGGDVLKVHRFFVVLIPLFALSVVYGFSGLGRKAFILPVCLVVVISWQLFIPKQYVQTYHFAEVRLTAKMKQMALDLMATDKSDFSAAVSTIGAFSYYLPGHDVIDMLGLTDSTIARHPCLPVEGLETTWKESRFNIPYLLSRQPDYILFSTGRKPSAPAEKALHLYSAFLNSYRTTTYRFEGYRHDIYKRYFRVPGTVVRDIDPEFIEHYSRGSNYHAAEQYEKALQSFKESLKFIPDTVFSYARYYIAENLRKLGKHEQSYMMLLALAQADTVTYEVYKDLYIYEFTGTRNIEMAARYRKRLEKLIPWYLPHLDASIGWRQ